MSIKKICARQIFDSRGNPTVEVELLTDKGLFRADVPSGASTGVHEAMELRDHDQTKYFGKGVSKAINNINNIIAPALIAQSFDVTQQEEIDNFLIALDGTENKSKLGSNAIVGVSMAVARAGAAQKVVPLYKHIADLAGKTKFVLPVPSFNVINGGMHSGNQLAMQEFMILPVGAPSFKEAMRYGSEVYHTLKNLIRNKYGQDAVGVGDEGGFAPNLQDSRECLDLLKQAIDLAGYTGKVLIGIDAAASGFFKDGVYDLAYKSINPDPSKSFTGKQLCELYISFTQDYPIALIEDPFDQDDWDSHTLLTSKVSNEIIGDDLLVTNTKRIQIAIDRKACNTLLLKINQIGSLTETIKACLMAQSAGWGVMVSHRSGETEDCFIADLAVGISAGQIKSGAPCRSERLSKYNQLLRIEEDLGKTAIYAGVNFRQPKYE